MASLNTMRTKFGVVLSIIIAGALLAFILSLKTEMGFSGNDPKVGEIYGDKILYSEFAAAYDDIKAQMGGDNSYDERQHSQMLSATWQSLLADHMLFPGFDNLGIVVPASERAAMLSGNYTSGVYSNLFTDPKTGTYNREAVMNFLSQVQTDPQAQRMWTLFDRQAMFERRMNKFMVLARGGMYVNSLEVARGVEAANNTLKGRYVMCRYSEVADSTVTVSNGDIKTYYKAHKAQYKQIPYRTISYVVFEVEPTDDDRSAIEAEAKAAAEQFAVSTDLKSFARENRHATIAPNFVTAKQLSDDESAALTKGKMYGPELVSNEWRASRVVEVRNVPETYGLRQIVLPYTDEKLADSLMTVINSKNFAEIAKQYSVADNAAEGGEVGEVTYSTLAAEFANALNGAKTGQTVKVAIGNSIQILNVTSTGKVQRHMQVATLAYPVEASAATRRAVHTAASSFAVEAKGSVETFNAKASEKALTPRVMNVEQDQRLVRGLDNSTEVVRWATDAKIGKISDIFNVDGNYVVAIVTAENKNEYKTVGEVTNQIRTALLRDKKYATLAAKLQGENLDEVATSASVEVKPFENAKTGAYYIQGIGVEPRLIGAMAKAEVGKMSAPVQGTNGVYVFVVDEVETAENAQTAEEEKIKAQAQAESSALRRAAMAMQDKASIKDFTVKYF